MASGMTEIAKALLQFWNSFGLPAYPERTVPDDAQLPYITYELKRPSWRGQVPYTAQVWFRDTSLVGITAKVDAISQAIGEGIRLPLDGGGCVYIFKEDSFVQMRPGSEEQGSDIKAAYLSMIMHAIA